MFCICSVTALISVSFSVIFSVKKYKFPSDQPCHHHVSDKTVISCSATDGDDDDDDVAETDTRTRYGDSIVIILSRRNRAPYRLKKHVRLLFCCMKHQDFCVKMLEFIYVEE